jgi:hypothetical protein
MKIYPREILDGIDKLIEEKNSIAFVCDIFSNAAYVENIITSHPSIACLLDDSEKQSDLYYLNSVLVSAGWNKNDDVFGVNELWAARHTPVNKQFNYMHDDSDIIGHITGSIVVDHNGKEINDGDEPSSLPEKLDIITSAVIYKTWSNSETRARIEELTKEIDDGKWSVSMECVFNNFDYALIGPNEDQKVLARTDESSFLTKHLRAYGGSGEFQGYKIGRLLKGFYFSGKGLVAKPANPRSIILNKDANPFNSKADITLYNFLTAMENNMNEDTTKLDDQVLDTSASDTALAEKEQLIESLQAKVKELEDSFAGMNGDKEKYMKEAEALKQKMFEKEEELKTMSGKYSAMVKEIKGMKRVASLLDAGADEQKANKIVEDFSDASDEMFASVVALLGDKKPQVDTNTKPETKPEAAPVDFGSEAADDDDSEEADASELDNVEGVAESALANPESSQEGQNIAIASAAAWLRKSVLKSTKSLK